MDILIAAIMALATVGLPVAAGYGAYHYAEDRIARDCGVTASFAIIRDGEVSTFQCSQKPEVQ
jgi:hypothetical protein